MPIFFNACSNCSNDESVRSVLTLYVAINMLLLFSSFVCLACFIFSGRWWSITPRGPAGLGCFRYGFPNVNSWFFQVKTTVSQCLKWVNLLNFDSGMLHVLGDRDIDCFLFSVSRLLVDLVDILCVCTC